MNIDFVDADAIAAAHICQSAFRLSALLVFIWGTCLEEESEERGKEGKELTFCIHISGIEGNAVGLCYGGIEGALHVVNRLRDKTKTEQFVAVEIIKKTWMYVSMCDILQKGLVYREKSYPGSPSSCEED